MKIVQGDEMSWKRGLEHRGGTFHYRGLLDGEPGRVDNYHLTFGKSGGDFYSPRHRHNFERVRFQLKGALYYDRDGKLTPGMVGYFPEGVFYGPQSQDPGEEIMTVVLQCGGASGSGYLSREEIKAGMDELRAFGVFGGGVFRRTDAPRGKRSVDGFQAIWEHTNGRPLEFPKPRYSAPILMDPANYDWRPISGAPSAYEKCLGSFTECGTSMSCIRLDPGAEWAADGRTILFAVSGQGHIGDRPLRDYTTIFLDHDEIVTLDAEQECELLYLGLPDLRHLLAVSGAGLTARAAE